MIFSLANIFYANILSRLFTKKIKDRLLEDGTDRSEQKAAIKKQDERKRTFLVAMLALVIGILIGAAISYSVVSATSLSNSNSKQLKSGGNSTEISASKCCVVFQQSFDNPWSESGWKSVSDFCVLGPVTWDYGQ